MITINLLPIGSFKTKYKGRVFIVGYILVMIIVGVALFMVKTTIMDASLASMNTDIQSKTTNLNNLKGQVTEAAKTTATSFNKWQQLNSIIELEERRRDQTRLLVEIDNLIPKTNAWLRSLKHDKGQLILDGIATDKETVSRFLTKLEGASYIERRSVTLLEVSQNLVLNGITLTNFRITASTVFPDPTIVTEGMPDFGLLSQEEFLKIVEAAAPDLVANIKKGTDKSGQAL